MAEPTLLGYGLDVLFRPDSVCVIGASSDPNKIGGRPIAFLKASGFRGKIVPVNPKAGDIQGLKSVAHASEVTGPIDIAIIAVSAAQASGALDDAIALGAQAVVMFTAGFGEAGTEGRKAEEALRSRAYQAGVRLLGPNSLGLFDAFSGFFGTFATALDAAWPTPGGIALATQSGAFGTYCFALAAARGLSVGRFIATGNEGDVDVADAIAFLARQPETRVILSAIEGTRHGAKLRAALAMAREAGKPVIIMKVGTSAVGQAAAASHTGSLAGADRVFDAVMRREGAIRAHSIEQMLDWAYALERGIPARDSSLGIITTSGGIGVLLADAAEEARLDLRPLPHGAQTAIQEIVPLASGANPVDSTAQILADMSLFSRLLDVMVDQGGYAFILAYLAHIGRNKVHFEALKPTLLEVRKRHPNTVFAACMLADPDARAALEEGGFLVFEDPTRCVNALAALVPAARSVAQPEKARQAGGTLPMVTPGHVYDELTAGTLLAEAGVPMQAMKKASDAQEAAAIAEAFGTPVAIKILSPDIAHKSDIGGVRLGVEGSQAVQDAAQAILAGVAKRAPNAVIDGLLIAPMAPRGIELILGVARDQTFGMTIMIGLGGIFTEVMNDTAVRPLPVDRSEAAAMLTGLKGRALLEGARGAAPVDRQALIDAIVALSDFVLANDEAIEAIDINPLIAHAGGVVGVDALILTRSPG